MGKISLFFTSALLLYLIGKIVTDERNVHQHTAYNDNDSVTSLATEVNRDTVTTSVIDGKRDTVTTSATYRDTVTTLARDIDRDTVITSATDRDTVTTLARDIDRDTVTTSATDSGRETEITPTTDVDRDAVTTSPSTTDVYSDTITVSATHVDRETVITPAKDMYLDDATGPNSNLSTTEITRDTTVTRSATDTVSISDIFVAKNDLNDFTTPTLENNDEALLIRSVERHTDAVTRPATVNSTARDVVTTSSVAQSFNSTSNGDLSNCSNVVIASCRQKCGVYRSLPCSCDQFCLIYKNCCPDYEMVCVQDAEIIREYYSDFIDVYITCLESPTMDTDLGLQVISGCPVQASEESKRLCNPANIKPVTLDNTNLHFINIHCLICNGFNSSDVTRWNLQIVPHTIELDLMGGDFEKLIQSGQFSLYPLPKSGIDLTYCCNKVIDHCEVPSTMEDKCSSSHSFYLKYGPARTTCLKNHFCAECNKNLYPDVCQWKEIDIADMKTNPRMAFLIETGNKDRVSVKPYGTRNQMFWSSAECKSPINGEFGVDITDCTPQECRRNIQLTDGKCLIQNKMFCFVIIANLSLIDQDINVDKLSGLLSQQAIVSLSQMNFTLGSFNTTFNKRDQLLLCDLQFVNETSEVNAFQFLEIYLPSVDMHLSKTGMSGNISICAEVNLLACSDTPHCTIYRILEISPRPSLNKGSSKLIGNCVLAIAILMKFMAAIIGL